MAVPRTGPQRPYGRVPLVLVGKPAIIPTIRRSAARSPGGLTITSDGAGSQADCFVRTGLSGDASPRLAAWRARSSRPVRAISCRKMVSLITVCRWACSALISRAMRRAPQIPPTHITKPSELTHQKAGSITPRGRLATPNSVTNHRTTRCTLSSIMGFELILPPGPLDQQIIVRDCRGISPEN
jgi:hypothetical protein